MILHLPETWNSEVQRLGGRNHRGRTKNGWYRGWHAQVRRMVLVISSGYQISVESLISSEPAFVCEGLWVSRMLSMTEIMRVNINSIPVFGGGSIIPGRGWYEKSTQQRYAVKSPNNWLWDVGSFSFYWFGQGRNDLGCSSCATRAFAGDVAAFAEVTWS